MLKRCRQCVAVDVTHITTTAELRLDIHRAISQKLSAVVKMMQVTVGKSYWWWWGFCLNKESPNSIFQHKTNSWRNYPVCWSAASALFYIICTKIKARFKALQGTGLAFVSTVSSTTGLWLGLVPAQCRLLKRDNKEARGGYFSARGLNLVFHKGCGVAAGPVRLFSHHLNSSNTACRCNFMTLPVFPDRYPHFWNNRVLLQHL